MDVSQEHPTTGEPRIAIRGVALDYGEVICHRPAAARVARMAQALGMDAGTFTARYGQDRARYDRGDVSAREYWTGVANGQARVNDPLLAQLHIELWSQLNPAMLDWLDRLRAAGFKTALLSNMHADMAEHVRRSFAWLARLDVPVLSCELRLIKPERAIYQRCVQGLGLAPQQVLFIDDRTVNVEGAQAAGLAALRFESIARLREDLARLHFPVLPAPER